MTAADIISRVRDLISDTVEEYRWGDTRLLRYISDGLQEIWRLAPDAFHLTSVVIDAPDEATATNSTISMRTEYRAALCSYVCWRALGEDAEDVDNMDLSKQHLREFNDRVAL